MDQLRVKRAPLTAESMPLLYREALWPLAMNAQREWPVLVQGGMGIGISDHRLARATAALGCLGVVSGTGIDTVFVRRLQLGDASGDLRRGMSWFPWPHVAERCLRKYLRPQGKAPEQAFSLLPLPNAGMSRERQELLVLANFVEVALAKESGGLVGINYLEKIQTPTLPSLFGALLAGVDVVVMGAGIPSAIPEAIERLSEWRPAELSLSLENGTSEAAPKLSFDPRALFGEAVTELPRPSFFAVVSSHVLAKVLIKKTQGRVDGFIVEDHTAGGHNAPPRRAPGAHGASAFGPRDVPQPEEFRALGVPFWLAGSAASPERLASALSAGASGVQLGTAFAFCDESGMAAHLKADVIARALSGRARVVTDFEASPTGYPFKRVERLDLPDEIQALRQRERVCDLGYLRRAFSDEQGRIGYRCPGEPVAAYVGKGGSAADTVNKLCLCNQLLATIGLGQARAHGHELPLLTAGDALNELSRFVPPGQTSYSARDVVEFMLGARRPRE